MMARSSDDSPKISDAWMRYWACLWCARSPTNTPMLCSSAATSSRSRSRASRPCSSFSSSNSRVARCGHGPRVHGVVAVLLAQRLRAGQHLPAEVREAVRAARARRRRHVDEQAVAQRRRRHGDALRRRLQQQRAVDEQRGHERLGVAGREAEPVGDLLFRQLLDPPAELDERVPRHLATRCPPARRRVPAPRGGRRRRARSCTRRTASGCRDRCRGRRCRCSASAGGRGARGRRPTAAGPGATGPTRARTRPSTSGGRPSSSVMSADPPPTSTSSACDGRERGMPGQAVPHREVDEAALLRHVDDVHLQPGPHLDAIEERVGVRRLAHGARRDGAVARRAVLVHQALEALERAERRLHRARPDPPRRERVLAERRRRARPLRRRTAGGPAASSATTRRTALAPMSTTATVSGRAGGSGFGHGVSQGSVHLTTGGGTIPAYARSRAGIPGYPYDHRRLAR